MESLKTSPIQNQTQLNPLKVLVADDDPPTRLLLKAGILRWGYKVMEATNGEEAWETLQKAEPPQIVILDWMMPKLDGIGLCLRIKEQQLGYKPYIILLTQITGAQNIIKGLEAGADEYLAKPFNMAELQSRLSVGAKLVTCKIQMKEYIAQINDLAPQISDLATQISTLAEENKPENTQKISELNVELKIKIQLLMDFNSSVNEKIKGQ